MTLTVRQSVLFPSGLEQLVKAMGFDQTIIDPLMNRFYEPPSTVSTPVAIRSSSRQRRWGGSMRGHGPFPQACHNGKPTEHQELQVGPS